MALLPQEQVNPVDVGPAEPDVKKLTHISPAPESPALLEDEQRVLEALGPAHRLTVAQLASRTALSPERVRAALGGLGSKGLVSRLNTAIESFCARFPRLRVGG